MNATEALMLRPDAADRYLQQLDDKFAERYPDNTEVGMMLKLCWENARTGECNINEALAAALTFLDDLDNDDTFGSRGWRRNVMGESS